MKSIIPIEFTKHYVSEDQGAVTVTLLENGYYGVAVCAENTEFNHRIGASLSFHRAEEQDYNSGKIEIEQIEQGELESEVMERILQHLPEGNFLLEDN